MKVHTLPDNEITNSKILHAYRHKLENIEVPIVTLSASFKRDLLGRDIKIKTDEIIFSRAHYSMAQAIIIEAHYQHKRAYLIDPLNFLSKSDWQRLSRIEFVGRLTARFKILKKLKDLLDNIIRNQISLKSAIEKPLIYAVEHVKKPIISLHYETGNLLASHFKKVLQIVTDPHVRPHYLAEAERENITFAVFDKKTKKEFMEKARLKGLKLFSEKIVVTGPPVDRRIVTAREGKNSSAFKKRPLRLVVTTSGLGSNFYEIKNFLDDISNSVKTGKVELILYAGTHPDFYKMFLNFIGQIGLEEFDENSQGPVRIIFDNSLVRANKRLIKSAFYWADGFATKPSGDMAYDAVAAGCFLLTFEPWGEWEENIYDIFSEKAIATKVEVGSAGKQINDLIDNGWIERAIDNAIKIDRIFLNGSKNIVDLQSKLK